MILCSSGVTSLGNYAQSMTLPELLDSLQIPVHLTGGSRIALQFLTILLIMSQVVSLMTLVLRQTTCDRSGSHHHPFLGRCDDDIPAPILTRNHDETPDGHRVTLWDADPGLLPHWWSQLRSLHDRLGVTECLEEGKVIYVCSWYLHGHNLRRCRHHRVLRLDPEWTTWLDIIKETWQDLLLRDQPVELGLVSPHPPAQVFQGHVAHLILSQDLDHVAAHVGIVSAIYRHTGGDIIVQNAHVLPMTISKEETIDLIPARPQCTIRHCDVQVGNTPAQGDVAIPVIDYTSIVVDIFPLSDDVDDFSSFMAAGTRHRPQPVDPHLMDRPTIARQEEVFDEEARTRLIRTALSPRKTLRGATQLSSRSMHHPMKDM